MDVFFYKIFFLQADYVCSSYQLQREVKTLSAQNSLSFVEEFQNYLQVDRGLSENSVFSYSYDLKKFQQYLEANKKSVIDVTTEDIGAYLQEQKSKNISARSIARSIAALRSFYEYLKDEKQVKENPASAIESPEIQKSLPEHLTINEVEELFASIHEDDVYELRDKAMFELMYSSGLRISEACNLRIVDVDMENMLVTVHGKGGRDRLVPFGEKSRDILKKYMEDGRKNILKKRESDYIFISKKSENINRKSAWRLLKKYIGRTSITKVVTPHTFRHSFATHLIENNADLRSVQELLGHIDISTTQVYTHLVSKTLEEAHKKYHPRS